MKRFWTRVNKHSSKFGIDGTFPTECWEWNGSTKNGYGRVYFQQKESYTHRVSWMLSHGIISSDVCVLHKCDNRKCVRLSHLKIGDRRENNSDTIRRKRHRYGTLSGELHPGAKLTKIIVASIRREYHQGVIQRLLAVKYKVSRSTIQNIVSNRNWIS